MKRATKGNIKNIIIDAIESAATEYYEMSGERLGKAPEYYLNVKIVDFITSKIPTLGYKLEMQVKELLEHFGVNSSDNPDDLRDTGNFDITLLSKKTKTPRHVIEVKRGIKLESLMKDARRISALAQEKHGSKRLSTGFIVFINRVSYCSRSARHQDRLDERLTCIRNQIGNHFSVTGLYHTLEKGVYGYSDDKGLSVNIFEISLI
ncbi:hypothetical protein EKG38_01155 [Shewanella canadensis]|uniref:Uncharacterized protein n=1 Tax=Shewanella canadensis TaxID=271096 RepID=A0A3S0LPU8_9GAMM|nr:hypothetical protein [Shewanella canadensis]RTR40558.1 hypothetical protein EKG38_01155 [Shewanella canadensis]